MFEGTDLSMAYGAMYETPSAAPMASQAPPKPVLMSNPPPPPAVESATKSHAMPPEVAYVPPQDMYLQQSQSAPSTFQGESFWDRVSSKRWEVLKLVVFALVILLAVSLDHVASHYLNNYLTTSFLTNFQEVMVRLAYPIAVVLLLWIIKASA